MRALRRHHYQRRKQKVRHYYSGWPSRFEKAAGMVANTACLCSCPMCGNPRNAKNMVHVQRVIDQNGNESKQYKIKTLGKKDRLTRQERVKSLKFELEAE